MLEIACNDCSFVLMIVLDIVFLSVIIDFLYGSRVRNKLFNNTRFTCFKSLLPLISQTNFLKDNKPEIYQF